MNRIAMQKKKIPFKGLNVENVHHNPVSCQKDNYIVIYTRIDGDLVYEIRYYPLKNNVVFFVTNKCTGVCMESIVFGCEGSHECKDGKDGSSFKFVGIFDCNKIYNYGDVVRYISPCGESSLWVYGECCPSKPTGDISKCSGWQLMMPECCNNNKKEECCDKVKPKRVHYSEDEDSEEEEHIRITPQRKMFMGDWSRDAKYSSDQIVKHNGCIYVCKKDHNGRSPSGQSVHWDLLISPIKFSGEWRKEHTYNANEMVTYVNVLYIAQRFIPRGTPIADQDYWQQLIDFGDMVCKKESEEETYTPSDEYYKKKYDLCESPSNKMLYATKSSNQTYKLSHLLKHKKAKATVALIFDKIKESSGDVTMVDNHITFTRPGWYQVNVHIVHTGLQYFKCRGYLLKPSESPKSESYPKERKIQGSTMAQFGTSSGKNYLNYSFPIEVIESMSSFVIATINKLMRDREDKDIIIHGKDKSWIQIQKLN